MEFHNVPRRILPREWKITSPRIFPAENKEKIEYYQEDSGSSSTLRDAERECERCDKLLQQIRVEYWEAKGDDW